MIVQFPKLLVEPVFLGLRKKMITCTYTTWHGTVLCGTVLYHVAQYCIMWHSTVLVSYIYILFETVMLD